MKYVSPWTVFLLSSISGERLIWEQERNRVTATKPVTLSFLVIPTNVGIGPQGPTAAAVTGEVLAPTLAPRADPGRERSGHRCQAGHIFSLTVKVSWSRAHILFPFARVFTSKEKENRENATDLWLAFSFSFYWKCLHWWSGECILSPGNHQWGRDRGRVLPLQAISSEGTGW